MGVLEENNVHADNEKGSPNGDELGKVIESHLLQEYKDESESSAACDNLGVRNLAQTYKHLVSHKQGDHDEHIGKTGVEPVGTLEAVPEEICSGKVEAYEEYDTEHTVFISYEFDGNSYENVRLSYYTSSMRIGNKVTIYCDPLNPSEFRAKYGLNVVGIVLYVIGGILALGGLVIIICSFTGKSKKAKSAYN